MNSDGCSNRRNQYGVLAMDVCFAVSRIVCPSNSSMGTLTGNAARRRLTVRKCGAPPMTEYFKPETRA